MALKLRVDKIDFAMLEKELGCKVIPMSALKGDSTFAVAEAAIAAARDVKKGEEPHVFGGAVEHALAHIEETIENKVDRKNLRWFAVKVFERDEKVMEELNLPEEIKTHLEEHIRDCEKEMDDDAESIITNQRYTYIQQLVAQAIAKNRAKKGLSTSEKIDSILTNRLLALPIFAGIMFLVYWIAVSTIGGWVTDWTNDTLFGEWIQPWVQTLLENAGASEWSVSLVVDGIIGGLAAPLGFVPQMAIVFLLLGFLEDCGYMARVAFIMDRIFRRFGLSGKSFIPFLISSGCGVPAILSTRTIESEKDRRMTMITTTMIPCGPLSPFGFSNGSFGLVDETEASLLAQIGKALLFIFAPLGFTWQTVASTLSGFVAKEGLVSTMGVLAGLAEADEYASNEIVAFSAFFASNIAALSYLVFNLFDSPCLAAISTMAKEMGSRRHFWYALLFQNVTAYGVTLMIYQLGGLAVGELSFSGYTVAALAVLGLLLYLLFRPDQYAHGQHELAQHKLSH